VRSKGDSTGEQCCGPAPFRRSSCGRTICNQSCCWRPNKCVKHIPDRVQVRNFIGEKFHDVQHDRNAENDGVGDDFQGRRQMDHTKSLENPERRDSRVEIEARGKSGTQGEAERLQRVHQVMISACKRGRKLVCGSKPRCVRAGIVHEHASFLEQIESMESLSLLTCQSRPAHLKRQTLTEVLRPASGSDKD